jgi:putative PIN family toxin of toxin-antitoxin system
VLSPALLDETEEVLNRPRLRKKHGKSVAEIHRWIADLAQVATMTTDAIELEVVAADPDDDVILACALEGGAWYLVTGDRHLLDLKQYRDIRIVTARQFWQLLEERR